MRSASMLSSTWQDTRCSTWLLYPAKMAMSCRLLCWWLLHYYACVLAWCKTGSCCSALPVYLLVDYYACVLAWCKTGSCCSALLDACAGMPQLRCSFTWCLAAAYPSVCLQGCKAACHCWGRWHHVAHAGGQATWRLWRDCLQLCRVLVV